MTDSCQMIRGVALISRFASRVAEISAEWQAQVDARAPAPTVSTGGRAHAGALYNRLSNCVPEYSRHDFPKT